MRTRSTVAFHQFMQRKSDQVPLGRFLVWNWGIPTPLAEALTTHEDSGSLSACHILSLSLLVSPYPPALVSAIS